jgi:acyl-CoA reductase-like NAD-dependent aldehyde dehydrogenase
VFDLAGKTDESENYIEPTVLTDVTEESPSMKEEIFGPVLPIYTMDTVENAITFINKRDKPLALYMFSKNKASIEQVFIKTKQTFHIASHESDWISSSSFSSFP